MLRRNIGRIGAMVALLVSALSLLGAGPSQGGIPPQPFLSDYFSGKALVQGSVAPFGVRLVACIDDCRTGFESAPVLITTGGAYDLLEVNPPDKWLRGRQVYFYLVNEHGRIRAEQSAVFEGAYNLNTLVLTFPQPLPAPPPTPSLPAVGDRQVAQIPRFTLGLGALTFFLGVSLLLVTRRRRAC